MPLHLLISDLALTPVDTHSPVPLYHQITMDLRGLITSGRIPPGSVLPPEMEICKAYGVGRQTIRMAIARLVDENLVERYAGRGTFVRQSSGRMKFYLDRSFSQQMRELGYQPRSALISQSVCQVDTSCPEALRARQGEPCLNLVRLRFGSDEPVAVQDTTVLIERCHGLDAHDFNRESLYEVLSRVYHLVINRIHHVVRAVAADEYYADLLQVPFGSPLLYVGTTAYLEDGSPIECTSSHYRADRYEYSTDHSYSE
jgi:GntR family transcriptional regulator